MNKLKLMLSSVLLSSQLSCATPPDVPVCTSLSSERGFCTYTISEKDYFVEGEAWKKQQAESLLLPAESYAKIKAYILKMCKKTGQCKDLASWERKQTKLEKKGKK